jgi:hypothetical protein
MAIALDAHGGRFGQPTVEANLFAVKYSSRLLAAVCSRWLVLRSRAWSTKQS